MNTMTSTQGPVATTFAPGAIPRRLRTWWRVLAIGGIASMILVGALAAGLIPRQHRERAAVDAAVERAHSPPRVSVAVARPSPLDNERVLPGNALPLVEAALFPRATGYIKTRLVDIGDRVKAGQLLAVIDAPDVDDQLAQAKADLAQAKANLERSKADEAYNLSVSRRYEQLVKKNTV